MKKLLPYSLILLLFSSVLVGRQVAGDIFSVEVYTGIFLAVFLIAIVIFVVSRIFNRE